jgi:cysteine desulfurase
MTAAITKLPVKKAALHRFAAPINDLQLWPCFAPETGYFNNVIRHRAFPAKPHPRSFWKHALTPFIFDLVPVYVRCSEPDLTPQPKLPVYLDHHATTPLDPRVLEAMLPYFTDRFGNAASQIHSFGRDARDAVESAREIIGRSLNARPQDICFTSGATESINLAIKGLYHAGGKHPQHFITVVTEHPAVLDSFRRIESEGAEVTYLPVDAQGMVDPGQIAERIRPHTKMVSVMAANNEIGVLQPLNRIGEICREHQVFFMTDATQACGKVPLDVLAANIDLLAASAHKIYGPKGTGILYCRRSRPTVPLIPIIDGGGHERGLRSGTLNVPGIVGFAKAAELAVAEMDPEQTRLRELRDALFQTLRREIPGIKLNGHPTQRLAGNLNVCIPGIVNESLILALAADVACSSGSACTTAAVDPSHVLKALGLSLSEVHASLRFGLGRGTTGAEMEHAAQAIVKQVAKLRSQGSP